MDSSQVNRIVYQVGYTGISAKRISNHVHDESGLLLMEFRYWILDRTMYNFFG